MSLNHDPGISGYDVSDGAARAMRARRTGLIATVTILLAMMAWQMRSVDRLEPYRTDSSFYQVLAHNLAEGRGYVFDDKPHTRFPPGFPAMLAPVAAAGGGYRAFVTLMPVFGAIGLIAALFAIAREDSWMLGAAACLLLASSQAFFRAATQDVLSDLPFFAVSALALVAASERRFTRWLFPVFVAASVLVRSAGLALSAAALAALVTGWRRMKTGTRALLATAAAAGMVTEWLWMRWASAHVILDWPGESVDSYVRQLTLADPHQPTLGSATMLDLAWRFRNGASAQMAHAAEIATRVPWLDPIWFSPFVLVPFALVLIGVAVTIVRTPSRLDAWYVVAYLGLYFLWPFDEGPRFIVPIFPWLVVFGWHGATFAIDRISLLTPSRMRALGGALVLIGVMAEASYRGSSHSGQQAALSVAFWFTTATVAFALSAFQDVRGWTPASRYSRAFGPALLAVVLAVGVAEQRTIAASNLVSSDGAEDHGAPARVAEWLSQQPSRAVMAQQTAVFHRLTGRRLVSFPVADGSLVAQTIADHRVGYLIVERASRGGSYYHPSEQERLQALSRLVPDCCQLLYASDRYQVYAVAVHR